MTPRRVAASLIRIPSAQVADLNWLLSLRGDPHFNQWIWPPRLTAQALHDDVAFKLGIETTGQGVTLVANVHHTPCGYATLLLTPSAENGYVEFGVLPSYFGCGMGGRLLDTLIARRRAWPLLRCLKAACRNTNISCIRLLESRAFPVHGDHATAGAYLKGCLGRHSQKRVRGER